MAKVWAVVPVKAPARSKTRLAGILERAECAQLCLAMLGDVLDAVANARTISGVAVVTADDDVAHYATARGHEVIVDNHQNLCTALDDAALQLAREGADTVLVIPADMPTVDAADIDALVTRHTGGLSIIPAIRDGGTNALLCTPPGAMPFCFGHDSARKHLEQADAAGIPVSRVPTPAFFRDIDTPDDLLWLHSQPCGEHTRTFLRNSGIHARLTPTSFGKAV